MTDSPDLFAKQYLLTAGPRSTPRTPYFQQQ